MTDILTKNLADKLVFMYNEGFFLAKDRRRFVHPSGISITVDIFDYAEHVEHLKEIVDKLKATHEDKADVSTAHITGNEESDT